MSHDLRYALAIEMGVRTSSPTGWFWLLLGGADRPLIAIVDDATSVAKPPDLELRAPGLWTELRAQVEGEVVEVDLEAFGVELDQPADLLGSAYGKRTALGAELEWDTAGDVRDTESGYELACEVHGELLIDDQTIELAGRGWRSHWWGDLRVNEGFSGFDHSGAAQRSPQSPGEPAMRVPLPSGVDHELVLGPEHTGWVRRQSQVRRQGEVRR